jgi:hypothetical protein
MYRRNHTEIVQIFNSYQRETVYLGNSIKILPVVAKAESIQNFRCLRTGKISHTVLPAIIRILSAISLPLLLYTYYAGV